MNDSKTAPTIVVRRRVVKRYKLRWDRLFAIFVIYIALMFALTNLSNIAIAQYRLAHSITPSNDELTEPSAFERYLESQERQKQEFRKALEAGAHKLAVQEQEAKRRRNISIVDSSFTVYTDLKYKPELTAAQMNYIIEQWAKHIGYTPFLGQGEVFIEASEKSGLNPVYILAHAAWESNWGRSNFARNRANYFGINARDSNVNAAYNMGSGLRSGIINGATWISRNYYDEGKTTLESMSKTYASDPNWKNGISRIVATSYKYARDVM